MIKLAPNEEILYTFRKHWFLPLVHTINVTLLFLIPIVAIFFLLGKEISYNNVEILLTFGQPSYLIFGFSLWGLILWLRFFSFWTDHHLDGWIITNKRIIDVEQKGFFSRESASFRMERLQDVTTEVKGIIATLLKFGTVHAQTAGTDREFVLKNAPNPRVIRNAILEVHNSVMEDISTPADKDAVGSYK